MTLAELVHREARSGRNPHTGTPLLPPTGRSDTSPRRSPGTPLAMAARHRLLRLLAPRLSAAVLLALFLASPPLAAATDWGRAVVDTTMRRHPDPAALGKWGYQFGLQMYGQYLV